jgi:hypothetical protein
MIRKRMKAYLDQLQHGKTAVEQLKERFEAMKLSYDAYRFVRILDQVVEYMFF